MLESSYWSLAHQVRECLETPAPLLERVMIRKKEPFHVNVYDDRFPRNLDLFAGCAPQLRILEAWGTTLPLMSPVLVNLTTLALRDLSGYTRPSLDGLIDALASMPHLQNLALRSAYTPSQPRETVSSRPVIHIPELRYFQLHISITSCATLLSRITYPNNTTQKITISWNEYNPSEYNHTLWNALGVILSTRIDPIRYLRFQFKKHNHCNVMEAWGRAVEPGTHLRLPSCTPNLQFFFEDYVFGCLLEALKPLPISGVEALHVNRYVADRAAKRL
ncbi:hypothetical protein H0H81_004366 [Sphagnurus paluster]|uniref:Uncharacterized protein n=1 Tax=Sphagnurus paluster TaxID=117069 RepID=A0A9P7FSU5_9AGAR|nr:hypothetical protein H0H81_004366 [Sphagnurus paluster]